jgi:hypothetical protein
MKCKICYCDEHVRRKGVKYERGAALPCPKCGMATAETKDLSVSGALFMVSCVYACARAVRRHEFGRKTTATYNDDGEDDDDTSTSASGDDDKAAYAAFFAKSSQATYDPFAAFREGDQDYDDDDDESDEDYDESDTETDDTEDDESDKKK